MKSSFLLDFFGEIVVVIFVVVVIVVVLVVVFVVVVLLFVKLGCFRFRAVSIL